MMFSKISCKSSLAVVLLYCFTIAIQISGTLSKPTEEKNVAGKNKTEQIETETLPNHDFKEMLLQPRRISRSAGDNFPPPMMKNRVYGRSLKFHEGVGGGRTNRGSSLLSPYSSPIARMLVNREGILAEEQGPTNDVLELADQDPTFTPYISARVFNMPRFMDHIRGNLESITDGEDFGSDEIEFDENDEFEFGKNAVDAEGHIVQVPQGYKGIHRWAPAQFGGGLGRPRMMNIRHFVQNPANRNGYEFGLG